MTEMLMGKRTEPRNRNQQIGLFLSGTYHLK
jgi:hypothetical protein